MKGLGLKTFIVDINNNIDYLELPEISEWLRYNSIFAEDVKDLIITPCQGKAFISILYRKEREND